MGPRAKKEASGNDGVLALDGGKIVKKKSPPQPGTFLGLMGSAAGAEEMGSEFDPSASKAQRQQRRASAPANQQILPMGQMLQPLGSFGAAGSKLQGQSMPAAGAFSSMSAPGAAPCAGAALTLDGIK